MTKPLPPHGRTLYPWKKWMDGNVHHAAQGIRGRIKGDIESFRRFLFVKAKAAGMKVETRVVGKSVSFRFFVEEKGEE